MSLTDSVSLTDMSLTDTGLTGWHVSRISQLREEMFELHSTAGKRNATPPNDRGHSHQAPAIRLLRTTAAAPLGTILLFPDGGAGTPTALHDGTTTAEFLNQCGFDVAILKYRINAGTGTLEMTLDDAIQAWRMMQTEPQAFGLHGGRFGIMGCSAGGRLAARITQALAGNPKDIQPDDLILIHPSHLDAHPEDSVWPDVLPPLSPKGRLFLLIAADDRPEWVSGASIYAKAWKGYDGQAAFHLLPDGGHGFDIKGDLPGAAKQWPGMLKAFLDANPEAAPQENTAAIPVPQQGMEGRHSAKVEEAKKATFDLILVGDSIIHNFENPEYMPVWQQYFAPRRALNLGYSGCRTENTIWNLRNGELAGQSPKVVTLMIGTNNVDEKNYPIRHTAGQLAGGIQAIIGEIRQKCPGAKILLLRPFPGSYDGTAPTSHRMILERAGDLAKALADNERVFYLDVNAVFLNPDGSINQALMPDCLHPNPEGARRWAEAMEPLLSKLMGDSSRSGR